MHVCKSVTFKNANFLYAGSTVRTSSHAAVVSGAQYTSMMDQSVLQEQWITDPTNDSRQCALQNLYVIALTVALPHYSTSTATRLGTHVQGIIVYL